MIGGFSTFQVRNAKNCRQTRRGCDGSISLADLLRRVLIVGGRASSEPLPTWATRELRGYGGEAELPDYRVVPAQLPLDGISGRYQVTGEAISILDLPEGAQAHIREEAPFPSSVGEIEAVIKGCEPGQPVKMLLPGAAELARLMTWKQQQSNRFASVQVVYWAVSVSAVQGVLDQIRTRLTEFVAEVRAAMPPGEHEPTAAQVQRAVQNIWINTGDNSPVNLTVPFASAQANATASAGGAASGGGQTPEQDGRRRFRWSRSK